MKIFDLNIEKILEDWKIYHAIRELIANALDEQIITKTKDIQISKVENSWIIRDFGRGLQHSHLTQNENQEKLNNSSVIGKFGIGLKDALATFDRHGIKVIATSKHSKFSTEKRNKQGFQDIVTLHAVISDPVDRNFIGTQFELTGVPDDEMESAKKLFLKFSGERVLTTSRQGQIIKRNGDFGNIYINGVKVAEEENFLFSYNITKINSLIKKSLNRERTNVGRTAYSDSIKKLLLASTKKEIFKLLAEDLKNITQGTAHDELSWIDVQEHSVRILNQEGMYLFITAHEAIENPSIVDQARTSGFSIITIPDSLRFRIRDLADFQGNPIIDIGQFVSDYNDSFKFEFISPADLLDDEKEVYQTTQLIIDLFGGLPKKVKSIKISTTMRTDLFSGSTVLGCWDEISRTIVLSRNSLKTLAVYAGTLFHELIHAKTGFDDITRQFENELTNTIGKLFVGLLKKDNTA